MLDAHQNVGCRTGNCIQRVTLDPMRGVRGHWRKCIHFAMAAYNSRAFQSSHVSRLAVSALTSPPMSPNMTCVSLPLVQFHDFRGGVNTKDGPFNLNDSEAIAAQNVTLTERGVITQRGGKTRFDTSGFPATRRAEHIRAWYPGSSKLLMVSIDGDIYSSTALGALTQRFDGTAGAVWCFEDMQDAAGVSQMWAANGVDLPKKLTSAMAVSTWVDGTGTNALSNAEIIRVWRNRMIVVAAGSRTLSMSKLADPENFLDTDFQIAKTASDERDFISWIEVLDDTLIVFTPGTVFGIYGEPPSIQMKVLGGPGCEGKFQSCVLDGRVYYWNRSGLWSTDGVSAPVYESTAIENRIADTFNKAVASKARLCASRDRRIFASIATGTVTDNNQLIEFIPYLAQPNQEGTRTEPPAVFHNYPISSLCGFRPVETDVLMGGNAANVGIHQLFTGTNDDGAAIDAFWRSSWKAINPEEPFERIRRVNVLMIGQATLSMYRDFSDSSTFSELLAVPDPVDPLWDGGTWDSGVWDAAITASLVRCRPESRGRYHSFMVRNNVLDKAFSVFAVEFAVRGGKEH